MSTSLPNINAPGCWSGFVQNASNAGSAAVSTAKNFGKWAAVNIPKAGSAAYAMAKTAAAKLAVYITAIWAAIKTFAAKASVNGMALAKTNPFAAGITAGVATLGTVFLFTKCCEPKDGQAKHHLHSKKA